MADNIVSRINPMPWPVVVTDPAVPSSGDPVRFGSLTGIALLNEGAGGVPATQTMVDFGWFVATIPVTDVVGGGIAVGDVVYYDDGADRLENDVTGTPFGIALAVVGAGATTAVNVLHCPAPALGANSVNAAAIAAGAVTTAKIADANVTGAKLAASIMKVTLAAGTAAATDVVVAGMAVGDEIVSVLSFATAAAIATVADRTSEYAAGAAKAVKAAGTNEANNQLVIIWLDKT